MVDPIMAGIAGSLGILFYILIAMTAQFLPISNRKSIGDFYLKLSARGLKQWAFLRRVLSGYDVLPIKVDPEQKSLKCVIDSSTLSDDQEYRFRDPDNRIKRLFNKPVAIAYEEIPAAIDAELAEIGYWTREKQVDSGLWQGDLQENYDGVRIDPYVEIDSGLHLVDPLDAYEIVPNDVDPQNVITAEQLTKQRFAQYGQNVGVVEGVAVLMGFITGVGGVAGLRYVNEQLLDGAGSSGIDNPIGRFSLSLMPDPTHIIDFVVMFL